MKGLLVKDLLLLKMQKNFFILVFVICAFMAFSDSDSMFPITFLTFVLVSVDDPLLLPEGRRR